MVKDEHRSFNAKRNGPSFLHWCNFFSLFFCNFGFNKHFPFQCFVGSGNTGKVKQTQEKTFTQNAVPSVFSPKTLPLYKKKVTAGKQVLVRLYSLIFWDHVLWTKIRQQQMMSKPLSKNVGGLVHVSCPKTSVQSSPSSNFSSNGRAAKKIFNLFW